MNLCNQHGITGIQKNSYYLGNVLNVHRTTQKLMKKKYIRSIRWPGNFQKSWC